MTRHTARQFALWIIVAMAFMGVAATSNRSLFVSGGLRWLHPMRRLVVLRQRPTVVLLPHPVDARTPLAINDATPALVPCKVIDDP